MQQKPLNCTNVWQFFCAHRSFVRSSVVSISIGIAIGIGICICNCNYICVLYLSVCVCVCLLCVCRQVSASLLSCIKHCTFCTFRFRLPWAIVLCSTACWISCRRRRRSNSLSGHCCASAHPTHKLPVFYMELLLPYPTYSTNNMVYRTHCSSTPVRLFWHRTYAFYKLARQTCSSLTRRAITCAAYQFNWQLVIAQMHILPYTIAYRTLQASWASFVLRLKCIECTHLQSR